MKSLGRTLFELSSYNEVWTDRQTDGRTDTVITIGLPHLRWRGPNYAFTRLICSSVVTVLTPTEVFVTPVFAVLYRVTLVRPPHTLSVGTAELPEVAIAGGRRAHRRGDGR